MRNASNVPIARCHWSTSRLPRRMTRLTALTVTTTTSLSDVTPAPTSFALVRIRRRSSLTMTVVMTERMRRESRRPGKWRHHTSLTSRYYSLSICRAVSVILRSASHVFQTPLNDPYIYVVQVLSNCFYEFQLSSETKRVNQKAINALEINMRNGFSCDELKLQLIA
jgi:hypothetical protein